MMHSPCKLWEVYKRVCMKMEYERYRRNETGGNVGIIPEDSEVIRRRMMLQEQQRDELRHIIRRKKLQRD